MKVPQLTQRIPAKPRRACIWSSQLSWMWWPDSKAKATCSTVHWVGTGAKDLGAHPTLHNGPGKPNQVQIMKWLLCSEWSCFWNPRLSTGHFLLSPFHASTPQVPSLSVAQPHPAQARSVAEPGVHPRQFGTRAHKATPGLCALAEGSVGRSSGRSSTPWVSGGDPGHVCHWQYAV